MIVLRRHDVFDSCQIRNQMELLKDDADLVTADFGQFFIRDIREIKTIQYDSTACRMIHTADDIHKCRLAGA